MDPIIRLQNVNFWYEHGKPSEYLALKDISFDINPGEYVAFFGASGSGKTTLLYLIAGIEQSQDGKIIINGRDISTLSKQELAIYRQVGVGMVFQQFNLIPSLSVVQNIILPMSFLGVSQERAKVEAMELLKRVGIEQLADRFPDELSGGQQQRVGIIRALANNPPIIVADEPLGNLDSTNAETVLAFLKELNEKDGRTVIMVTHEAWSLRDAKKIFFIKDGVITEDKSSSPKEVGQTISQRLYSQLSPELSKTQLTAQALSSLFLRGYSAPELKRFEFFLSQRLENKIDADLFRMMLGRPWHSDGLGLWKQKANKVSQWVEEVIEEKRDVESLYKELETHPEAPLADDVEKLKSWLVSDYRGELSDLQSVQLREIIVDRIRGVISSDDMREILNLPRSKAGLGFSIHTAERIKERLDFILNNGHPQLGSFSPV
jgi:ABC-type lipoprotein export system ATPase subunit